MPRRPRLVCPEYPLHVIQRGHNRQACFFSEADYQAYLATMAHQVQELDCRIHAYVLMTNHVHLLISFADADAPSALMKGVGQWYSRYVNKTYGRTGTLWEGRYRSCVVQDDAYLLTCQRYIELNPLRAGMAEHPADYPWSSYHANANGRSDPLIQAHPVYKGLAHGDEQRRAAYRSLFETPLADTWTEQIRQATNGNFALGDQRFPARLSRMLGRRTEPGQSGRPRKTPRPEAD